tara:strand:- start:581 stop:697 length:117 start_codon:yes stop_codon:yes gene_type:complete
MRFECHQVSTVGPLFVSMVEGLQVPEEDPQETSMFISE